MLLGHARGKVGDLVFSRANGQQVVRARPAVVKNPQTEAQMIQRIILNTVSQAYSRMRAITDHSFEGVQPGQKTMSAFMRRNLDLLRQHVASQIAEGWDYDSIVAFTPVGSNEYSPFTFTVSQGSLPSVAAAFGAGNVGRMALTANTYEAVISDFGLQRGDQLTFVGVQRTSAGSTTFHYCRVILDPVDAAGAQLPLSTAFVGEDNKVVAANPRNEGDFSQLAFADGGINYKFAASLMFNTAIIVSRKDASGNWMRSNADMVSAGDALVGFTTSLQEALEASKNGGFDTLNSRYLNNAGVGTLAGAGGETIEVELLDEDRAILTAVANGQGNFAGYIVAVTEDGDQLFIKNTSSVSPGYDKVLVSKSNYVANAWAAAPAAANDGNTVGCEGLNSELGQWLLQRGVEYKVWVSDQI